MMAVVFLLCAVVALEKLGLVSCCYTLVFCFVSYSPFFFVIIIIAIIIIIIIAVTITIFVVVNG